MRREFLAILLLVTACAPAPTEADRADLIGTWLAADNSGKTVVFTREGVFDYNHTPGYIFRLDWTLDRKGKVRLVSGNGVEVVCYYTVASATLDIDDGSGGSCTGPGYTPPVPMPLKYTRVQ
jgi:hypothetical protein